MITLTNKRWTLKSADEETVQKLSKDFPTLNPVAIRLLAVRGINNFESAKAFFRPELSTLHDPFLMKGMDKAVTRICEAIEWHERILIYGDYDVDGTTAVAVVYSFLKKRYDGDISYYIPHRYREGYGISRQGIDYAHNNGYTLLITLDCGIKSNELIQYAQSLGIDVIVCDHHLPDDRLPPAYAILNPKQSDCMYPYKELSGCGIGYKLISALARKWNLPAESTEEYLDLVTISIAADIVPVDGENRVLAYFGIKKINENPCLAIKTLKQITNSAKRMSVSDLVFVIGPRVNAAGRMDDARKAVELFIETDPEASFAIAESLHSDNTDRREIDKSITEEALQLMASDEMTHRKSTVLYQAHWHKGVVGIVASRLVEHFYRPTIILAESNGKVSGSARSVSGFNIYDAIYQCRDLLENYGGHFYAAGMTMALDNVNAFIERFEEVVSRNLPAELQRPEILIDSELALSDVRQSFYNLLQQFEPFGPNNMRPVFVATNVHDYRGYSKVVKDQHIRFVVHQPGSDPVEGIGFNLAAKYHLLAKSGFDMVFTIEENEFNGQVKIQIKVLDIRPSLK